MCVILGGRGVCLCCSWNVAWCFSWEACCSLPGTTGRQRPLTCAEGRYASGHKRALTEHTPRTPLPKTHTHTTPPNKTHTPRPETKTKHTHTLKKKNTTPHRQEQRHTTKNNTHNHAREGQFCGQRGLFCTLEKVAFQRPLASLTTCAPATPPSPSRDPSGKNVNSAIPETNSIFLVELIDFINNTACNRHP